MDVKPKTWRTEAKLRGLQAVLQRDINGCADGAYVTIDLGTAHALIDVLKQARHTEVAHMEVS